MNLKTTLVRNVPAGADCPTMYASFHKRSGARCRAKNSNFPPRASLDSNAGIRVRRLSISSLATICLHVGHAETVLPVSYPLPALNAPLLPAVIFAKLAGSPIICRLRRQERERRLTGVGACFIDRRRIPPRPAYASACPPICLRAP